MIIKTKRMQELERDDPRGRDIREIVRDAYIEGGSTEAAGALLGITGAAFSVWVERLDGEIRSAVEFPALEKREPATAGSATA